MKFFTVSIFILLSSLAFAQEEEVLIENTDATVAEALQDDSSSALDEVTESGAEEGGIEQSGAEEQAELDSDSESLASPEAPETSTEQEIADAPNQDESEDSQSLEAEQEQPEQAQTNQAQAKPRTGVEVINLSDTIVGNQEQPTVLYIVPWKEAQDTTILYLPLSSKAIENIFGHVERLEHQRQVQYIDQLDKQ